jgi:hypothetical protein
MEPQKLTTEGTERGEGIDLLVTFLHLNLFSMFSVVNF